MYKVISPFADKYNGDLHAVGEPFTSDEPERIEDLLNRKLIEGVPDGTPSTSINAGSTEQKDGKKSTKKKVR